MKNKIIAILFLVVVYCPFLMVVYQEVSEQRQPWSDTLALVFGAGLMFMSPIMVIRLLRK